MKAYSAQKYRRFDYFRAKIKVSSMRKYFSDPLFRSRLKEFLKERYHSHRGTKEKKKLLVKANRCSVLKSIQIKRSKKTLKINLYMCVRFALEHFSEIK